MFANGFEVFFRAPTQDNRRVLIPAKVMDHEEGVTRFGVDRAHVPFEAGAQVLAYFTPHREFMQQPALIVAVEPKADEAGLQTLEIQAQLTGEPTSAEGRACYRASTVLTSMTLSFDRQINTRMLDVSPNGLSVESTPGRSIGELVQIGLTHNGKPFVGTMCLQSIKELGPKRSRYGLCLIEERGAGRQLRQGLQQVSMQVQRDQLKRQSGAA